MAISGDLRVAATLAPYRQHPFQCSLLSSKVDFVSLVNGGSNVFCFTPRRHGMMISNQAREVTSKSFSKVMGEYKLPATSINSDVESFLLNAINMSFFERLNLAWKIIFPSPASRSSNASIAKQRLKMILFSDRCAVSDEAKQKIVKNIVHALSDFVEIESQDKVQLSVSTDSDVGTIYSVTVPVRRVKPEYQEADETGMITNVEYKDKGEQSGAVDVTFDFYVPDE